MRKHAHYFRSVAHLGEIDIYRLLDLFGVTDQALGHAIKKLVAPGGRGAGKDFRKDVQEAIDTLQRRLEMLDEDAAASAAKDRPWVSVVAGKVPVTGPVPAGVPIEYEIFDGEAWKASVSMTSTPEALDWSQIIRWRRVHPGPDDGI